MSAVQWSAVDDDTADLLALVANDQMHPRPAEEWDVFVAALRQAADASGRIDPNDLRPLVRDSIAPRRIGAFTNRALSSGLVAYTGEWVISNDNQGRNSGKPARVLQWIGDPA